MLIKASVVWIAVDNLILTISGHDFEQFLDFPSDVTYSGIGSFLAKAFSCEGFGLL